MRHLASIGIVIVRDRTLDPAHALAWPALAPASSTPIDVAPGQHRHRHRRHPSMRLLASIGIVIVRNPRHGACLGMAGVGVGIGDLETAGAEQSEEVGLNRSETNAKPVSDECYCILVRLRTDSESLTPCDLKCERHGERHSDSHGHSSVLSRTWTQGTFIDKNEIMMSGAPASMVSSG